jgi:Uma2 family endonuclease
MPAALEAQPDRSPACDEERLPLLRVTVDEYHRMIEQGVIWGEAPVELLQGLLIEKRHDRLRHDDPVIDGERMPIYRFHRDDYVLMRDAGLLADRPVEFLEGLLLEKMVRRPPHDTALGLLQDLFAVHLPAGWFPRIQSAIELTDGEPEPDLAIVRGERRDYAHCHPTPADCGLVIEIADATLSLDRGHKLRSYAKHSVCEYWIVNLVDDQIEVMTQPSGLVSAPTFKNQRIYQPHESIPVRLDGRSICEVSVQSVLPDAP